MRTVLVAVLLAPVVFASVVSAASADAAQSESRHEPRSGYAAAYPEPEPIDHTQFAITADYSEFAEATEPLDELLPNVDVSTVMANAGNDRRALCHTDELDGLSGPLLGMCFSPTDTDDCKTYPQGLTTTRDATNGDYDGHQLVATAWYHKQACGDAPTIRDKLVLADWDADHPDMYQKLMLVYPYIDEQGKPNFRPHTMHMGGISWYGDYLYVTAGSGLRIFDMRKIWEVSIGPGAGRQPDGTYQSHNYRYVLPSIGTVRNTGAELTWSTLGLDRASSPSLVTTEWIAAAGPSEPAVRFPLNPETMRFEDGEVTATQAFAYSYPRVQGAVSHNGRWWFGASGEGTMYYWSPSEAAKAFPWVTVTEGLSYWESADNPDVIWTVRENSGSRNSFAVQQAEYS